MASDEGERRAGALRALLGIALAVVVGLLLWRLRGVLTPIFFALLIAYMLDPLADKTESWGLPRAVGIVGLLTVFASVLGGFLLLVLPGVVHEIVAFAEELPAATDRLLAQWEPVLADAGLQVPHSVGELMERLASQGGAEQAFEPAAAAISYILGGTASAAAAVVNALMIPVFAFYLLYDFDRMTAAITRLVPPRHRPSVVGLAHEIDDVLGQFIRGQLLVMVALALLYSIGYSIVGVRLAIPIGIVAGLLSFIPYVGGASAVVLAAGMVLFDGQGVDTLLWVLGVYGLVQALEGFVITPGVVGDKVGLSAIWVLFALVVFGELFGFLGVLLAVPAAAVVKIFLARGVRVYRQSSLYGPEDEEDEQHTDNVDASQSSAEPEDEPGEPSAEEPDATIADVDESISAPDEIEPKKETSGAEEASGEAEIKPAEGSHGAAGASESAGEGALGEGDAAEEGTQVDNEEPDAPPESV